MSGHSPPPLPMSVESEQMPPSLFWKLVTSFLSEHHSIVLSDSTDPSEQTVSVSFEY